MEVRFLWDSNPGLEFKKCGFHLIYEQDIEYIREMISAQSNNSTCVTPMRVWMLVKILTTQQKESK